jgi:hypothetical protein
VLDLQLFASRNPIKLSAENTGRSQHLTVPEFFFGVASLVLQMKPINLA